MSNNKKIIIIIALIITSFIQAFESPPVPPAEQAVQERILELQERLLQNQRTIENLPLVLAVRLIADYKRSEYTNMPAFAAQLHSYGIRLTPSILINIFKLFPRTANALSLAALLADLPVMQDPQVVDWIDTNQKNLRGNEALSKVVFGSEEDGSIYYKEMEALLAAKNIDLNGRSVAFVVRRRDAVSGELQFITRNLKVTPLMIAAWKSDPEAVKLLLRAGADVAIQDEDENTALDYAVRDFVNGADTENEEASPEFKEVVNMFIDAGAGIPDERQAHALMRVKSIPKLKVLLDFGFHPNSRLEKTGYTPLMHAAAYNQKEKAKVLIDAGANVNAEDSSGRTPLMWAADNRVDDDIEIAAHLIEAGADPLKKNNLSEAANYLAHRNGYLELENLIRQAQIRASKRKEPL